MLVGSHRRYGRAAARARVVDRETDGESRKSRLLRFNASWLLVLMAVFLLAACASDKEDKELDEPADKLYNEALVKLNSSEFTDAEKKFKAIDRLHPYSEYSRRSLIMIAHINYTKGNYQDTINSAKRFITLYPRHKDAAYAQYLIGISYFRQIPDITRDQEMAKKALVAMAKLVQNYPKSEYAEDARKKVAAARDQLAGKEMQVGRYYLAKRNYIAAINRFKVVITSYQTTRHVEEALARVVESYLSLGVVNEAQTAAAVLGHNFPNSTWYRDAHTLLEKGGYDPKYNSNSWIAKAFDTIKIL